MVLVESLTISRTSPWMSIVSTLSKLSAWYQTCNNDWLWATITSLPDTHSTNRQFPVVNTKKKKKNELNQLSNPCNYCNGFEILRVISIRRPNDVCLVSFQAFSRFSSPNNKALVEASISTMQSRSFWSRNSSFDPVSFISSQSIFDSCDMLPSECPVFRSPASANFKFKSKSYKKTNKQTTSDLFQLF